MASQQKIRRRLEKAVGSPIIRRLSGRTTPDGWFSGFVLAVGRKWVLVAQTREGGYPDGHVAIRISGLDSVREAGTFESRFAASLPSWPPRPPYEQIDLDTTRGVLRSLGRPGRLIGLHGPNDWGDEQLWIGVPHRLGRKRAHRWDLDPSAEWDLEAPVGYRIGRIGAVEVGDEYQRALAATADPVPEQCRHGSFD